MFGADLTPVQKGWMTIGLLGQLLFTGRMLVQWWASERAGRSLVPRSFWWLSLCGSLMILAYGLSKYDPVIVIGQIMGPIVYSRNLVLLARRGDEHSQPPSAAPAASPPTIPFEEHRRAA